MLCSDGVPPSRRSAESVLVMRCALFRCLVVLLSLALIGGNARAGVRLAAVPEEPCAADISHDHGHSVPAHHDRADHKCCCDCLGCTAVAELTTPFGNLLPAFVGVRLSYRDVSRYLTGRSPRPEPGPPRPVALS